MWMKTRGDSYLTSLTIITILRKLLMDTLFICNCTTWIWTIETIVYGNTIEKISKDGQKNYLTWQTVELDGASEITYVNMEYGFLRITTPSYKPYVKSFNKKNTTNRRS